MGGNFYVSDVNDNFQAVPITVTLSNGHSTTFTPTSDADSYRGFTTAVPITSLVLGAPGANRFSNMDNLTVGGVAAVPEPGTYAMMALGLAAIGGFVARRRKQDPAA